MAIGSNDIFISYGRGNENSKGSKTFSTKLYEQLEAIGFDVWLDNQDIPHAVDFQKEINEGIKSSDNFVFIISPHAVASLYCLQEIQLAVELNKRIIPLLHVEPDAELLEESLHPIIKKLNWIYFNEETNFEKSFEQLKEALKIDQAYLAKHTEYTTKAVNWRENNRNNDLFLWGSALKTAEKWLKNAKENKLDPAPSNIQQEYISKSRKYNNYRTYRRIAAVIVFILVSSTLSMALYYSQKEKQAAREALKNIQLANSNELVAKASTIQCDESEQAGLRVAALAYEADTSNIMAKAALYENYYRTFQAESADEHIDVSQNQWSKSSTGGSGDTAKLKDAQTIEYLNESGQRLATFHDEAEITGISYDAEKQIIYAKRTNGEVVSYHLATEWLLKNMEEKQVPQLNKEQLNKYGIKQDLYSKLQAKLQKFQIKADQNTSKEKAKEKRNIAQALEANNEKSKIEDITNANIAVKEDVTVSEDNRIKSTEKSAKDYLTALRDAFKEYEQANENERLTKATHIHWLSKEAKQKFPDNASIERAFITGEGYLANEYVYKNMPDSALAFVGELEAIAPKEQWIDKTKTLALLQKGELKSALATSTNILNKKYPLASTNITYGEVLEAELNQMKKKSTLNKAQNQFLTLLTNTPIEFTGLLINDRSTMTNRPDVSLKIYAKGATEMMISNTPQFSNNARWETFQNTKSWKLQAGQGKRTVYIKFRNATGEESEVFNQSILLTRF